MGLMVSEGGRRHLRLQENVGEIQTGRRGHEEKGDREAERVRHRERMERELEGRRRKTACKKVKC